MSSQSHTTARMVSKWPRNPQPEIVLCDIGMPGMDGYRVAAELRTDPATAAACLIAISGYANQATTGEAAVFDHYLVKPVDPSLLEKLILQARNLKQTVLKNGVASMALETAP